MADRRPAPADGASPRELIASIHSDAQAVTQAAGPVERSARLGCEVLLLGGSRNARNMAASLDELEAVLPRARRVTLRARGTRPP